MSDQYQGLKFPNRANCELTRIAREFLQKLGWKQIMFDSTHDRCYCSSCYLNTYKNVIVVGKASYVIPRNFTRFGLTVDRLFTESHDVWYDWIVTYHGTHLVAAQSIITNRQFCLPGDRLIDGSILGIRAGHIPDQKFVFTSPTIAYSSSPIYSPMQSFLSSETNKQYYVQVVLQCRQKPNSFKVQKETIGARERRLCPFIPNERIEYFTDIRSSIVAYGLLVRAVARET
jgi:hypothetical protein